MSIDIPISSPKEILHFKLELAQHLLTHNAVFITIGANILHEGPQAAL
jgi:hypothetical protein